ncbi:hypothetical protein SK168_004130 [Salmonella enterica]|nr:hypothetical protein [Salmonella enterica]ELX8521909.1 hypothetical protein [Salmonella enterica]
MDGQIWPEQIGIRGRIKSESAIGLNRNQWSVWVGIRIIRQVETSPDVRTLGKVTDSTPTENNSNRLIRLDDGTTLMLDTTDDIPAGVTAVLRRTDKRHGEQQNWLCLKALSTEHTTCYRLKGNLF